MNIRFLSGIAGVLLAFTAAAQTSNILDIDGGEATVTGIYIKDLASGRVIVDHNSQLALTPASVTKAVTSATALATLGPGHRFTTRVTLEGSRSDKARGKWNGNLVIHASADPTTGSSEFPSASGFTDSIIAGLRRLGINAISGTVIITETLSDAGPVPQWEAEDIAWPYGAGLYGFNYNSNTVRIYPNTATTEPPSNLKITVKPSDNGRTDLLRGVNSQNITVWASKQNLKNKRWNTSATIPDPAAVYGSMLKTGLRNAGITISGKKASVNAKPDELTVYNHRSPSLAAICRNFMKRSDNLFAEGMLRALRPGETREKCLKAEKEFWSDKGLSTRYAIINDGSGLSRSNRLSPRFLGDMLEWMARSEWADTYLDFFPVAGIDGTLKSFLSKTSLKGRLAMKTGSVSSVQTYAGYKIDADGKPTHVVVVMVNGFFCPRGALRRQIEKYLLEIFDNSQI